MKAAKANSTLDVCLVAGGTGGHIFPAIAVASALRALRSELTIDFVTDARPNSVIAIKRTGFDPTILPMRAGVQRSLSPKSMLKSLNAVFSILRSVVKSWVWLRSHRPRVVVGFGAYVTVPMIVAARALRIPVVVHEQNAFAGLANRLASRLGATCAVSAEGTNLPRAVLTGNPVRAEITGIVRAPLEPPLVAFVGASLGSNALNAGALGLYERWRDRDDIALVLVTGPEKFEECQVRLSAIRRDDDSLSFGMSGFEHDMATLYSSATLMVTRGGGSIWELCAAAMPAIIVPWPNATEDHQTANAKACVAAGGAVYMSEPECTTENLAAQISAILGSNEKLAEMSAAMRAMARPNAANEMASLITTLISS